MPRDLENLRAWKKRDYARRKALGTYRPSPITSDPAWQERRRIQMRERYAGSAEVRQRQAETVAAWKHANPDRRWVHLIWWRYRLRPDDYRAILEAQGSLCAVCRQPFPSTSPATIDHDHLCDHDDRGTASCRRCVRGILCTSCNLRLGSVEDIPWLREALRYLGSGDGHVAQLLAGESFLTTYAQGGAGMCGNCNGSGALYDASSCPHCDGTGQVHVHMPAASDQGDYLGGKDDSFNQPGSGYGLGE